MPTKKTKKIATAKTRTATAYEAKREALREVLCAQVKEASRNLKDARQRLHDHDNF